MNGSQAGTTLRANRMPQAAAAFYSDVTTFSLSLWIRGIADLPEASRDRVELVIVAMVELQDESPVAISWRDPARMRKLIDERVAGLRAARTAQLRARYAEGNS